MKTMTISMEQIKEIRQRTGAGVVDAKAALTEAAGNIDEAINVLRKKGKASAAKKAARATAEGVIASYVHSNLKVAVLVSVLCETDFVARTEKFQELARNLALHIAAMDPLVVSPEDISEAEVEAERQIAVAQDGLKEKPAAIQAKIIEGKLKKFREERALLTQPYVKDPKQTVQELIEAVVGEIGENITVEKFCRLSI